MGSSIAFDTCVLSHKRPAWPDLIWLRCEEHDGDLYDGASTKGLRTRWPAGRTPSHGYTCIHNGTYATCYAIKRCCVVSLDMLCAALILEVFDCSFAGCNALSGNPCNAKRWITQLRCVIHPKSLGSGSESPAPSDEQERSLENNEQCLTGLPERIAHGAACGCWR